MPNYRLLDGKRGRALAELLADGDVPVEQSADDLPEPAEEEAE
ncbi:hypothetical protein [Kitasatospora purpeofusca]